MKTNDFLKQNAENNSTMADKSEAQQKIAEDSRAGVRAEELKKAEKTKAKPQVSKANEELQTSITFRIGSDEKAEWDNFFNDLDYSISLGIRKAVRYYMKQYKSGRIEV